MQLGYSVPNNQGVDAVGDLVVLAVEAEALGYNSVWVSEHLFHAEYVAKRLGDRPYFDPLTVLTAIACATSQIRLGTSVLVLPWHHPARLGKTIATLDHLSMGRVDLGVGVAIAEEEFNNLNITFADRGKRTDDVLASLAALWYQDVPAHDGPYYQFSGQRFEPKPRQAKLPIHVGGGALPALRRVAKFGQGWHALGKSPNELTADLGTLRDVMRVNTEELHVSIRCVVDIVRDPGYEPWGKPFADRRTLKGSPEEIYDIAKAYRDAGVDELVLDFATRDIAQNRANLIEVAELLRDL